MDHSASERRTINLPVPDYEADDVLVVSEPEQLRALSGDLRTQIVLRLRERARSTTELAEELGLPKGTVGHHLKVLEKARLIRVVRTRKVRAVTEKYYGRVARLFVIRSSEPMPEGLGANAVAATVLRQCADELALAGEVCAFALVHARLADLDRRRFELRLERLVDEFRSRETADGAQYALAVGLYPTEVLSA
ncbi:MAG: ArsR/SmtB family transcription factor [Gaiellaceae bacterium]